MWLWNLLIAALFSTGLTALLFLNGRSFLVVLMAFELMFFAVGIGFIYYGTLFLDYKGYIYAIVLLAIAASEAAVGLALVVLMSKTSKSIQLNEFTIIKH